MAYSVLISYEGRYIKKVNLGNADAIHFCLKLICDFYKNTCEFRI